MSDLIGGREMTWAERRAIVLDRAGYECAECGSTATEADHKWPRSHGGTDAFDNLQALCRTCNAKKGNRLLSSHMTPANLQAAAALRLDAAVKGAIGASRWSAMSALMSAGSSAEDALHAAAPGVESIPEAWRRWVVRYVADSLGVAITDEAVAQIKAGS